VNSFPAVNTLYNALLHHPDFKKIDFSKLKISTGGGMAVQRPVAEQWKNATGCSIAEGYGLSETSPTLTCNTATTAEFTGSIGLPDAKSGEAVKALVVKKDPNVTPDDIIKFCHEQLTNYKVPKQIEFRTELPKTNVGKILRRQLRDEKKAAAA